ncbi:molybdenum cofactor guanylyltransferase [Amycolatopsis sp. YIM 10]|uniref:molybdenum cofactor guanylyltransferase n=1 Tax=Amycolatopsis sp. YIM 10 TaxID=2653857 RepID=UPI0012903F3D|nr:NTP transferase domain-containing protein [Amycolatopsis sp. YIM 10]QFU90695.1 Molybdenum cofactor guanylyltransferase [Amycolatopsis sp. YIM 10]
MFAGIVLAGGEARRLGGVDKPMLEVGGRSLLEGVLAALGDAGVVDPVVVGPPREGLRAVRWTREDPPGGGPVAALAAGLALLPDATEIALLAGDLTGLTSSTVDRLRGARGDADGALLVDAGRRQWLTGVWRAAALRAAVPAEPSGAALRRALGDLSIVEVPAAPGEAADVDTPEDLHRLRGTR